LIVQLACLLAASAASAGQIAAVDGKVPAISIGGRIEPGDEKTFHSLVGAAPNALIVLAGPGGNVGAALAIGYEIRARGLKTFVPARGFCASSCALIWLAGTTRLLGMDAHIGFHALSVPHGGRAYAETHEFDPVLMHYLLQLGYAGDATATIVNTPSLGLRWLDRIELNSNGFGAESYP
jgi:hypothetical protein